MFRNFWWYPEEFAWNLISCAIHSHCTSAWDLIISEDSRRRPRTFKKFTLFIAKSFDANQTHAIFLKRSYHIRRHPKPSEDVPEICGEIVESSDAAIFLVLYTIPTFWNVPKISDDILNLISCAIQCNSAWDRSYQRTPEHFRRCPEFSEDQKPQRILT